MVEKISKPGFTFNIELKEEEYCVCIIVLMENNFNWVVIIATHSSHRPASLALLNSLKFYF